MRIQDLESRSGLERATIRYYEKEGLLQPARTENGYRDYTDADLEEVKRIRLFRQLEMPLEQIRLLQLGTDELTPALSRQLRLLEDQAQTHRTAKEVCSRILAGERCYTEISADIYLQMLQNPEPPKPTDPPQKTQTYREILRLDHHPGRRFFARLTDYLLLHGLLLLLVVVGLRVRINLKFWFWFITIGTPWFMIPLEALMLWILGTTPGKFLFGVKLKYYYGIRFTFVAAIRRSWLVFRYGLGFNIPLYNLFRLEKSYEECDEYPDMQWDDETNVIYEKWNTRTLAIILLLINLFLRLYDASYKDCLLPKHRGDLTIAQFAENYNFYAEYLEVPHRLNPDGTWVDDYFTGGDRLSDYTYELEDGKIKAIHLDEIQEGFEELRPLDTSKTPAILALSSAYSGQTVVVMNNIDYLEGLYRFNQKTEIKEDIQWISFTWALEYDNCNYEDGRLDAIDFPMKTDEQETSYAHIVMILEVRR